MHWLSFRVILVAHQILLSAEVQLGPLGFSIYLDRFGSGNGSRILGPRDWDKELEGNW